MRLRKQKEVAKENEFYVELLQKALPQEVTQPTPSPISSPETTEPISNGVGHLATTNHHHNKKSTLTVSEQKALAVVSQTSNSPVNGKLNTEYDVKKPSQNGSIDKMELQYMEHQIIKRISSVNDFDEDETDEHKTFKSITASLNKGSCLTPTTQTTSPSISTLPVTKWNHTSNHLNSNCLNAPAPVGGSTVTLASVAANKKAKKLGE